MSSHKKIFACGALIVFALCVETRAYSADDIVEITYAGEVEAVIGEVAEDINGKKLCLIAVRIRDGVVIRDAFYVVHETVKAEIARLICDARYLSAIDPDVQSSIRTNIGTIARLLSPDEVKMMRRPLVYGNWNGHQKALKFAVARLVSIVRSGGRVFVSCKIFPETKNHAAIAWIQDIEVGGRTYVLTD
ncbi:MAG: hypothetical protein COZ49_00805 [Candidatus Yonathbacteria bacterium CG_4_10_14_3_um_filter_47_65]|uniref:Uncharacterized protein n=2 Tax=Parcubacteria group TaxID=1794811 RepID=A0A2M8D6H5_9BACT|nr:MAG: hypothetical protein AUJ44_03815 [Candidatus Nomurabacteria bacterium CG1_02_47_685]PIP04049.1 MAG: hypothetical protein COX54_01255 [Candidatus Yonathbacteria bacterium CG23_combo_of_CG06-09_8_20_14_all_46_18]PIQ32234.1 MAG: hypothetical protein COW61_02135 [Candidatus Yonathbacteria bacterium CG17_big_fil_post_rev_8_21_14_2_50_46_19]PIX56697.1 MAG: hypothetical protein COZ49_00805 [Candidatus Yonathbacteria bacterium CG_4_10_14_3_um_filter_47_65]PIY57890.1 MAG: hypothetical protein CO